MELVRVEAVDDLGVVTLDRGKVNALTERGVDELGLALERVWRDPRMKGLVLTGNGSFFSFGFDVPHFLDYSQESFVRYLSKFTALYTDLYLFPKPVIAALNGHTIAGGAMLAIACDRRLMAAEGGKISLNEVTFGATVFAGCVEILRACVGTRNAERILLSGAMFSGEEAFHLGLVDAVTPRATLLQTAVEEARGMLRDEMAFRTTKRLLREPIAERIRECEAESIQQFVEIWYSPATRRQLERIVIR